MAQIRQLKFRVQIDQQSSLLEKENKNVFLYQLLNTVLFHSTWGWMRVRMRKLCKSISFCSRQAKINEKKKIYIHYFIWQFKNRNPTQLPATRRYYETLLTEVLLDNIWSIEVANFYLHCIERENYVSGSNSERIVNRFSRVRNLSDVSRCMAPHLTVFFIEHRAWTFVCDWS